VAGRPPEVITRHGTVSLEVAGAMAVGVRRRFAAECGLVVTGIAGPEGTRTRRLEIGPVQPREVIRRRAARHALNWVRLELARRA
jgi:nicotinamide-nucleotide amidase